MTVDAVAVLRPDVILPPQGVISKNWDPSTGRSLRFPGCRALPSTEPSREQNLRPVLTPGRIHGRFLRLDSFLLQDCASQRNAPRISLLKTAYEKQTARFGENPRKTSLLNYKSAALRTELCRHFARGNATFSSNFRPHSIRNFLWDAS